MSLVRPRFTPCLLRQAPLQRVGPPAAVRLRRHFHTPAPSPAEYSRPAEGRKESGAGRRVIEPPLRDPHHILGQRVHPRGREEEGDDGGVVIVSRLMQRGPARLQGRGRRGGRDVRGRGTRAGEMQGGAAGGRRVPQEGHSGLQGLRCGFPHHNSAPFDGTLATPRLSPPPFPQSPR